MRGWDGELCDAWDPEFAYGSHGHERDACVAWNSISISDVDLDQAPAGKTHWTQTSVEVPLRPSTGNGGLPPGYGDPFWFAFDIPMTLHVTYVA